MTPERWQEIDVLVQAALERRAEDRSAFLAQACSGDEALRREVESLISYEPQADAFLEQPAFAGSVEITADEQQRLLAGSALGRYRIKRRIGAGGMGEVYLAADTQLERTVALKVLPVEVAADRERMQRFVQEAKAVSALNHPNIITIHEIGQFDGTHFIAIEYVNGETLRERLQRESLTLAETLDLAVQIAAALAAAHEAGIVHRDIKPENIMLRADGLVKVLDFGLAKLTAHRDEQLDGEAATRAQVQTQPGMILGTVAYMSPEQARGLAVDARTDIFSLGVVWYEMLAGRLPFAGETTSDVLAAILKNEPAPLTEYVPELPEELERMVNKALRKNREERYQHSTDLLIDLRDLKQELAFAAKLERTAAPTNNDKATAGPTATDTESQNAQTTSSAEYIVSEIKQHRRGLLAVLALLLLVAMGLSYWSYAHRAAATDTKQIESIAVLPFQNASGNSDTEYLSDGISEALINSLTELRQLKVIARTTAFRYKGKDVDPQAVGRELNVRAVLMGRVRQTGDTLNVQVDLVDAATGAQLWGAEYERKVSDALSVKQAIAREVTEKLRLKLSGEEQQRLVKRDTTNAEAYQFYLRGRYFWNKRTADNLRKAIGEFQQAIDRDPNYALGYVGLADCYVLLEQYAGVPASETLPKARAAADRALQLDDSLSEAHTSSALIYQRMWRWAEVEAEHKRAISLNPNYPTAHQWFAGYLQTKRQFDAALREIKRAQELDPLSPIISDHVAWIHLLKNDLNAVIEQCQRNIELNPNFPGTHYLLGAAYLKQRRHEEATAEFQKAVELSGRASQWLSPLGYCYAVTGRRTEARRILKDLEEKYARREATGQDLARVYAGLGEKDQAFAWLEKDFEQHSGLLQIITSDYSFADLRSDPRYADLVRRMGLQP